jgi:hypothetical protein
MGRGWERLARAASGRHSGFQAEFHLLFSDCHLRARQRRSDDPHVDLSKVNFTALNVLRADRPFYAGGSSNGECASGLEERQDPFRHCTDQNAVYFLLAERLKESAERAVLRL